MRLLSMNLILIPLMAVGLLSIAATHGGHTMALAALPIAAIYSIAVLSATNGSRWLAVMKALAGLLVAGALTWLLGFWLASQI